MAKCPRCNERKAKRFCPALSYSICPKCCGMERLQSISCPSDCQHLAGEYYQLERRRDRARSSGKAFLETLYSNFANPVSREFGFNLQADLYWWMRNEGRLENSTVARAIDDARERLASIVVDSSACHALTRFLLDRLHHQRFAPTNSFGREHQSRALVQLARAVRHHGESGFGYCDEISAYFDCLDFEADLDYSPEDVQADGDSFRRDPDEELGRSAGGIILPRPS